MFNDCGNCCQQGGIDGGCGNTSCTGCDICAQSEKRSHDLSERQEYRTSEKFKFSSEQAAQYEMNQRINVQTGYSEDASIGNVVEERTERARAHPISEQRDREYLKYTTVQPIDTVTRTVEIPVVKTVNKHVPKIEIREKVTEVPVYEPQYKERIIEHPEIQYVDKIVEVPEVKYNYIYKPKPQIVRKTVEVTKDVVHTTNKYVEVPVQRTVARYDEKEVTENVVHDLRIPQVNQAYATGEPAYMRNTYMQQNETAYSVPGQMGENMAQTGYAVDPSARMEGTGQRIEQVFRPQVVQNVEIRKEVPVSVDVPVAYMVPKPVVIPVQVPVLKFKDHFVPVPVRRRVIPRIKWTNEIFEVECIKEVPYLEIQDVIKPVPCDVEIKVHEYVHKAVPINPTELSQADIHAMWMRVNADLAEKKKEELGKDYPNVKYPEGTVFGEPGCEKDDDKQEEDVKEIGETDVDPLALHPGHPLSMTYLQNQWMQKDTLSTHKMYNAEWFQAHQRALHTMEMKNPTAVECTPEQAEKLRPEEGGAFGDTPWLSTVPQQPYNDNEKANEEKDETVSPES